MGNRSGHRRPDDVYDDRADAGRRLGRHLAGLGLGEVVVLGVPRGGVPVAAEVAHALQAPLDAVIVRKVGIPGHAEVAMGAIGEGGVRVRDDELIAHAGVSDEAFTEAEAAERATVNARVARLRGGRPALDLTGRTALIVDDGIATGATASAACRVARRLGAARVIVAAPVASPLAVRKITGADRVVCLQQPEWFEAVGAYYRRFEQTTDDEVESLLRTVDAE
ncbi:phosphoribosyltransferase [Microbacterium luticocti]|uniref:phosphoribosyltransferase n=1 Tax=Microbacterium luticocti TaxID=451764 RepID=UPI0003FA092C|nr:phosphoribosyltransferase family protein [Microbacterium luticocti]